MYEYLVSCKSRKKLMCVATKEELKPRVSSVFEIPLWAVHIQMYVENFKDYVDVDDSDDIPSSCKLMITDLRDGDGSEAASSAASTVQILNTVPTEPERASTGLPLTAGDSVLFMVDAPESGLDVTTAGTAGAVALDVSSDGPLSEPRDSCAPNSGGVPGNPQSTNPPEAEVKSSDGWFNPKVLSQRLQQKLQTKARLVTRDWSEITDQIFSDYVQDTASDYPAPRHYHRMASTILRTYPHLTGPLNLDDAETWLRRKLQDKFRNQKRSRPKKRKSNDDDDGEKDRPASKRRRQVVGLPGYDPKGQINDTMAIRHINMLKDAKSEEDVDKLMEETFLPRRRSVLDGCGLALCQRDYPTLFSRRQFWKEVDRLAKKDDWLVDASAAVANWCRMVAAACACAEDDALRQVWRILVGEENPEVGPIYLKRGADDTYTVETAGGVRVFQTDSEKEALMGLTMAYSVFNLNFPRKAKPMLLFMQKVVLKVDDGVKLPAKVVKFCLELNVPL